MNPVRTSGESEPTGESASGTSTAPDWLELGFSWASGALVAMLLAYLLRDATRHDRPAAFRLSVGRIESVGTAVRVPVTIDNTGDRAAQGVVVTVTLHVAGGDSVETHFSLDWLAGGSSRRGSALFPRATASGARATADVTGFAEP